ncbi:MAG: lytic transglycosylase domain-containing protein [Clostridia bacterium]|nr:lytic transglycosylase domain-containing protein [Clostridia bacterium]
MKINIRHVSILLAILLLSFGFGFAFDAVATAIEKYDCPIVDTYAEQIRKTAEEFALPEAILWAVVRTESNFASNAVGEDGGIGLMQITPNEFHMIQTEILGKDAQESGLLYDPKTNLRIGGAYLSYLYQRYGVWYTVFAAYTAGCDTVDEWMRDDRYINDHGTLISIPDADIAAHVAHTMEAQEMYSNLYFD